MVRSVDEFAEIAAARARLDERELDLIDRARRRGATWAEIARALGLGSRQAAEQRHRRLAAGARSRQREQDSRYGLSTLRATVVALSAAIGTDARWDARFPRAALVRETVASAAEAGSGPLFALAAQAATDLTAAGRVPAPIHVAVVDLRRALRDALPPSTSR
jgi:hypothetical protein